MTTPNASEFTLHRWFVGGGLFPVYRVTWENAWAEEDDDGEFDNEEQERDFPDLDAALAFGKLLIETEVEEPDEVPL